MTMAPWKLDQHRSPPVLTRTRQRRSAHRYSTGHKHRGATVFPACHGKPHSHKCHGKRTFGSPLVRLTLARRNRLPLCFSTYHGPATTRDSVAGPLGVRAVASGSGALGGGGVS